MAPTQPVTRVISISPGASLRYAYELMREHPIRHLPVVDNGKLVGLLSDRDLLLYGNPVRDVELEFPGLPVSKVMTTDVITCHPDASVSEVIGLMLAHKVNAIPLVDEDDNLLGLVSSTDFLALLSDSEKSHPLPFRFEVQPPS